MTPNFGCKIWLADNDGLMHGCFSQCFPSMTATWWIGRCEKWWYVFSHSRANAQKSSEVAPHNQQHHEEILRFEPGSYLEIIPWQELSLIQPPRDLPSHFIPNISFDENDTRRIAQWAVWGPSNPRMLERLFVTEEEVYQYHLINQSTSKDYLKEGRVLFSLTPIEETNFCSDVNTFWYFWVLL